MAWGRTIEQDVMKWHESFMFHRDNYWGSLIRLFKDKCFGLSGGYVVHGGTDPMPIQRSDKTSFQKIATTLGTGLYFFVKTSFSALHTRGPF